VARAKGQVEEAPEELATELVVEGDGPTLGEDITPEEDEVLTEDDELVRPEGVSDTDWLAYTLRQGGATWRHTAESCGWAWVKGNMDGGRALRAVRRVEKAIVKAELASAAA
jgi:hypothetical protein